MQTEKCYERWRPKGYLGYNSSKRKICINYTGLTFTNIIFFLLIQSTIFLRIFLSLRNNSFMSLFERTFSSVLYYPGLTPIVTNRTLFPYLTKKRKTFLSLFCSFLFLFTLICYFVSTSFSSQIPHHTLP